MRKFVRIPAACRVFLLLSFFVAALNAQTVTLKVIETTDVHGAIFPYDFINDKPAPGSLAQVAAFVKQERSKHQEVLLLDAGDILQGQPVVYYYNFERPLTRHLYSRVMNDLGYEAATVGNHDIEAGHLVYDKFRGELNFPWLAANAVRTADGKPYFKPYVIIKKAGIKIAVMGMITPAIPSWLPPQIWEGMQFEDMIETARKWLPVIRKKEKPDLVFGLFHSGVDANYGGANAETPRNENASQLVAARVPGFDIVFVGHDHHGWNFNVPGPRGGNVMILGASSDARDVAVATILLTYDRKKKTWQKEMTGERVSMAGIRPDPDFLVRYQAQFDTVKQYVSRRIGRFTQTVSTRDAMFGNSAFVDLVHRIQLQLTGADISVSAPLSRNATIAAGPVYVRDMFKLYKYENLLYTMNLTGAEILGFLEYSYANWFNQMTGPQDHLLNFRLGDDGQPVRSASSGFYQLATPSYNFDSMGGITYTVDVSQPPGKRVKIESLSSGQPFEPDKTYKVAINSYRGNGGGGHLTVGAGIAKEALADRIVTATERDLRYFLMKWIERERVVTPRALGNWQVVPADWWQAGKARDFQLLYESVAKQASKTEGVKSGN